MAYLRIVLIVVNGFGCVAFGIFSYVASRDGDSAAALVMIGLAIGLGVNALYLHESQQPPRDNRLARMWRMWLDAKEAELKKRSTGSAD